jgi:SP family sugar:H+ symporter-like MFS transporter
VPYPVPRTSFSLKQMLIPITTTKSTADYFGRRNAMSLECTVFVAGVIIQVTAFTSWVQVALGRLVSGLGVGAPSITVPIVRSRIFTYSILSPDLANLQYQAETAPPQIRGTMT